MQSDQSTPRKLLAAAAIFGLVCIGHATAVAQPCSLPDSLVSAASIPADGAASIKQCVAANKDGLTAPTPAAIKRARNAILTPFRSRSVSGAFRLAYSQEVEPIIRPLFADKREEVAINALRIAGEIGTNACVVHLTSGLADKRPAVRTMAVAGFQRTFSSLATDGPALTATQAAGALTALQTAMARETEPLVLDSFVLALQAAIAVPDGANATFPGLADSAMKALAVEVGRATQSTNAGDALHPVMLRASGALLTVLTAPAPNVRQGTLTDIGGFTGDIFAYALRRVRSKDVVLSDEARAELAVLVSQAENLYNFDARLLQLAPVNLNLGAMISKPDDALFQRQVLQIIGTSGVLVGPPPKFPADRFIKK